jgi:hypothetical protein
VLLHANGAFLSFGNHASAQYLSTFDPDSEEEHGLLFFDKFKMRLYQQSKLQAQEQQEEVTQPASMIRVNTQTQAHNAD